MGGATSLTAARLLGKLALAGRDGEMPGAKVVLLKVALLGSVRDLARVLLRLDALKAFLASLFEGLVVEGFVESGMTGAFRVSLVNGAEATLAAAIASHF